MDQMIVLAVPRFAALRRARSGLRVGMGLRLRVGFRLLLLVTCRRNVATSMTLVPKRIEPGGSGGR